ncbi:MULTISPECIES: hypothetical protein [Metallosphaera]|uniref:Uncharacterized protein n=3 Tax=Metallosphaera TaxID=41980 RepID=A4YGT1_METS5|nr:MULTISPECIES: hypothetical protein [Metallosphaera]ABP95633.1 hypothetical protein Msed_1476 [Metallosphaera sedula DSM 5348]AIM27617.1 hypothetical protein HA72_1476 [Metallosphaera sedula]AKV74475.1 hypothetical protein MsedA_1496 [Metallosphaera sedula]AKV76714.1 hypothetical protein MsedB_1498 [Metallosphaera sedula]AKV78965.1 hypothetical protein MsedC_1496 [Metallosphaera sedula]
MAEELMKPGEKQLEEIRGYLFDLLDNLNDISVKHEKLLASKGIMPKLAVLLGMITMQRYQIELVMKYYWKQLEETINSMSQLQEIQGELGDVLQDVQKIKELASLAGLQI